MSTLSRRSDWCLTMALMGFSTAVVPVSYTHLDVYKRQEPANPLSDHTRDFLNHAFDNPFG